VAATVAFSFLVVLFVWGVYESAKEDRPNKLLRWSLITEPSVGEEGFLRLRPSRNEIMLLEVRSRIARHLQVPDHKISRDMHLMNDQVWERCIDAAAWIIFDKHKLSLEVSEQVDHELEGVQSIDELADRLAALKLKYRSL
jgi:hypothetical protein